MTLSRDCKRCLKCGKNWVFKHNYCPEKIKKREHKTPHQEKLAKIYEVQQLMKRTPEDIMLLKIKAEPKLQYDIYKQIKDNEMVKEVFVYS